MTIQEQETRMTDRINALGDCLDQYTYLIAKAGELPPMKAEARDDRHLVAGCQSKVWLCVEQEGGRLHLEMDSDTLILRGVLALLRELLEGRPAAEVARMEPLTLFDRTELAAAFSSQRSHGVRAILREISQAARTKTK